MFREFTREYYFFTKLKENEMNSFIKNFQNNIFHKKLFERGDGIVVGISGGPDSTCLTLLLHKLKKKYDWKLILVHVNYGLRGKESDEDEKFVRELAEKLGEELEIIKPPYFAPPFGRKGGTSKSKFPFPEGKGNLEEAMRDFRYKTFEKIRKQKKYDWIAVAHTQDDQVETFLMNLIRGAGLRGASGLKETSSIVGSKNDLVRPLLSFKKQEIIEFLKETGQDYRIDKSNLETELFRNKIRLKLIPLLEKEYNPQIKNRLTDLRNHLQEFEVFVEQNAKKKYNEIVLKDEGQIVFETARLTELEAFLLGQIFRLAIAEIKGNLRNITQAHFFEFQKILESGKGKIQNMQLEGMIIQKKDNKIIFKSKA